jgi:hypothetical protein
MKEMLNVFANGCSVVWNSLSPCQELTEFQDPQSTSALQAWPNRPYARNRP